MVSAEKPKDIVSLDVKPKDSAVTKCRVKDGAASYRLLD